MKCALPIDQCARRRAGPPRRELSAHLGQLADRHARARRVDHRHHRRLAPGIGHRQRVEILADLGEGPVSRRRHQHQGRGGGVAAAGRRRAVHLHVGLLVGPVPADRHQAVLPVVQVDAVRVGRRVREGAPVGRRHQRPVASFGRDGYDVRTGSRSGLPRRLPEAAGRPLDGDQPLPVRRPRRVLKDRRAGAQPHRRGAAVRAHLVQMSAVLRGPGDERDPRAVGRPGRLRLDQVQIGESARLAVRDRPRVEPVERREGQRRPVGRGHRVADLPDREPHAVVDRVLEGQLRPDPELGLHAERHRDRLGVLGDRDAPDFPAVGDHDLRRIGRERHAGQHVGAGHRLLVVALNGIGQPALLARGELAQPQAGLVLVPRPVDQPRPVGRHGRAQGRPVARRPHVLLAGLPVVHRELVLREDGVVLPQALPLREPDAPSVGRRGRSGDPAGTRLLDELDPGAALDVPHPQLRVAPVVPGQRARADRRHHVVAVRQPLRRLVVVGRRVRHLPGRLRVDVDQPEVLRAVAIRDEDHLRPVRAVARLAVVGHPFGQRRRVAAGERDGVEVAQQVEDDGPAVRADIHRDPCALVRVERQGARRLQREIRRVDGILGLLGRRDGQGE